MDKETANFIKLLEDISGHIDKEINLVKDFVGGPFAQKWILSFMKPRNLRKDQDEDEDEERDKDEDDEDQEYEDQGEDREDEDRYEDQSDEEQYEDRSDEEQYEDDDQDEDQDENEDQDDQDEDEDLEDEDPDQYEYQGEGQGQGQGRRHDATLLMLGRDNAAELTETLSSFIEKSFAKGELKEVEKSTQLNVSQSLRGYFETELLHLAGLTYMKFASKVLGKSFISSVASGFGILDTATAVASVVGMGTSMLGVLTVIKECRRLTEDEDELTSDERQKIEKKFVPIIWNATRFIIEGVVQDACRDLLKDCDESEMKQRAKALQIMGRVLSETKRTAKAQSTTEQLAMEVAKSPTQSAVSLLRDMKSFASGLGISL